MWVTAAAIALFALSAWWDGDLAADALPANLPLILLNTAPLLLLGRNPLAVVLLFGITYPLWLDPPFVDVVNNGHVLQSVPTLVAMYATGSWDRPLWVRACALVTPAWMMGAALVGYWATSAGDLSFVALVLVIVWGLGVVAAGRRTYADELERKTVELEAARHALADQAVARERSRIARELHDVVAHAMSVITVQAGVGGHLLATRPHRAAEALGIIERTGRDALEELRRMLVVLRPDEQPDSNSAPQPGLADLPTLLEAASSAGVRVRLQRSGAERALAPGLDLAVYRVIQEALTNVAKHAPGAAAAVRLDFQPARLGVDVTDDGGPLSGEVLTGQGLRGMAERVALYDGRLETAATTNGFRVTAWFPLAADEQGLA